MSLNPFTNRRRAALVKRLRAEVAPIRTPAPVVCSTRTYELDLRQPYPQVVTRKD